MKIAIHTLGCKVNQAESQALALQLRIDGHELCDFSDTAEAYIINSCTVTAMSDRKSRQAVYQARRRAPEAVVALCGCFPQVSPEKAAELEVDLLGGTGERALFLERLYEVHRSRQAARHIDEAKTRSVFEPIPAGALEGRTRAMLKVQDGCANFCSYCIIPYARGPVRSLALAEACREAERLAREGYREIVLTGIELSSWGRDLAQDGGGLICLIEGVCAAAAKAEPGCRIRLGSLEPRTITAEFAARLAKLPNLCAQFHLSLQSGSDDVLRRMGRRYTAARYAESCALLRAALPETTITADLIVGFPGEREEDLAHSLALIEACALLQVHIFPYSPRPGTPAADMPAQHTREEKARRAERAEALAASVREKSLTALAGRSLEVLFEEEKDGLWRGHSREYLEVCAESTESLKGRIALCHIIELRMDAPIRAAIKEVYP